MRVQKAICSLTLTGLWLIGILAFTSTSLAADGNWEVKGDWATPRYAFSSSVVHGRIYAIGGLILSPTEVVSKVEEYDPVTGVWTDKADMPTARDCFSTCVVDGKIYAIGGFDEIGQTFAAVEEYDPITDSWVKKADMPTPRWHAPTAVVDGKIYVIGGGAFIEFPEANSFSIVEEYDPKTDTWTKKADMPTPRNGCSASVVNGKIYVIGGATGDWISLPTVEEYDPVTDTWTPKADMPTPRNVFSTRSLNGKIYATGGIMSPAMEIVAAVEEYDPITDTWQKRADMTAPRFLHSTNVVNGEIYALGGASSLPPEEWISSSIESYTAGDATAYENVFFCMLSLGLNMISLPLRPITPYTARSFAQEIGATVVIEYDETLRRFVGFDPNGPGDGFPIDGGKGYIVNVPDGKTVPFSGAPWTNEPHIEMAPPMAQSNGAWAFVVSGSVDARIDNVIGYTVILRNMRTGAEATEGVDASGYFTAAWADLSRKAVIGVGDQVEVALFDSRGELVSGPFVHEVTLESIRNAVMDIHLKLGVLIPAESALFQNYPNPFNPETWIPFHLSQESDVSVRIHDANGRLIRNLSLGYRSEGIYVDKGKAIYWDGRNDSGEAVASGIYFYSIQAGDFTATRKMTVTK